MIGVVALFFLAAGTPEQRAVDYLAREVPKWSRENHCYSCHNNGDGARVLFQAARQGYTVPKGALDDTRAWLLQPDTWDNHQEAAGFSSPKLAHIQFAASLAEARLPGGEALLTAAEALVKLQEPDGSWRIDTGGAPGAPATYGVTLATYMARRTLDQADRSRFGNAIRQADRWLLASVPENTLDAAALLLALPRNESVRAHCRDLVLDGQTSDGGWGPQRHAPAEAFDTAVVLLALNALGEPQRTAGPMARGRAFLLSQQLPSGGWTETTRPSGMQSYAEHISTTAWALEALLATNSKGH